MKVYLRARRWSRTALALGLLFGTLPLAGRLFLGSWGFPGAVEAACLCLIAATYLHVLGRRRHRTIPDAAAMLDLALQLAAAGRTPEAITVLTETIRLNPGVWQAFQYRGELYLKLNQPEQALRDLNEAVRLAPQEEHLRFLRDQAMAS